MSKFSLKKLTAVILIVTMIFTSKGLAIFAEAIDDMDVTTNSTEALIASPSNAEDKESYDSEYEEEIENDETETIKSSEDEVATASGSDLANVYDTASSSDLSDDVEEETSTLATESEITLDIDKSSESEIKLETTLPLFGDTPLFGDAAPDTIWLGTYPQSATWQSDGSAYNIVEPIKWRKLSESGTEALYVADKLLDNVQYHPINESVNWGTSHIRGWLNDTSVNGFVGKAFTTNQLDDANGIVLEKTITTNGADTNDRVFLLSRNDVTTNPFTDDDARKAQGTAYAKSVNNGGETIFVDSNGNSRYWLRETDYLAGYYRAAIVHQYGTVLEITVDAKIHGVRPAIYINLSSPLYKTSDNGVSWDLNGGSFETHSQLWNSYTSYFGGQLLPTASNFEVPTGKHFVAMSVNAEKSHIATLSIPDNQDGDITLEALWGDTEDDKAISYDFGVGSISNWSLLPRVYTPGTAKSLPDRHDLSTYITHPSGYPFAGFAKSGTTDIITEIADTETENITLVPIWGPYIEYYESASDTVATVSILRNVDGSGTIATFPSDLIPSWVRTGYDFVQWRDKTTGAAITNLNIAAGNMNDIKVYPEWRERPLPPDTIWLGTYPQSATWQSNGSAYNIVEPIKWRKLSHNDTEALYVADKILDNVSYHAAGGAITWAGSGIHTWLNDTSANGFIGKAFTTNQLDDADGIVLEKTITTTDSADTNDKAFLLSVDEAQNLITSTSSRRASGTEYAKTKSNGGPTLEVEYEHSHWWLRSPGTTAGSNYAAHVRAAGYILVSGGSVNSQTIGARPAIYLNLESPLYKTSNNGVSWDLNGGSFETNSTLWESMNTYFGGQALPTADNFIVPTGKYFIGVSINTAAKSTINTIIPDDLEGDITLRLLLGDSATDKTINYDFGAGIFTGWSLLPGNYTPGNAQPLPTKSDLVRYITPPADKEFKGFAKEGTTNIITEIADTETTDINLVAIYRDRPTITWNMGSGIDIGTLEPEAASPSYISGIEWQLPSQDKITPPNGCEFDHWILRRAGAPDIDPATIIPETLDVNVEIIAVYNPLTYSITWDMGTGSDGGTLDPIVASASYTHGTSYSLPMSDKITPPVGREFDHWKLIKTGSGEADIEPATNIDKAVWGDITIKAVYNNLTFPITWILNGATIDEALMPAEHTYGTAIPLPNVTNVTPPEGKVFNYWLVNGTKATSISANLVGNVTVTLVLKDKSPSPYYPPSGGGGSSGGGGGGANYAMQSQFIPTTSIDQIKTLKAAVDSKQVAWVYDPIANSFKMNITIEGQTIPAIDGFYLVNKTTEQNINGTIINTPATDTYYFDKDGKMLTGWIKTTPDNKWYFLESIKNAREGAMVFGWYKVQNDWYYFTKEGSMLVNATTPDGHFVGPDGRWIQ